MDLNKRDFIGKDAPARIKEGGVYQRLVGLRLGSEPIVWHNKGFYSVKDINPGDDVGYITSAFRSPNMQSNIALAVMPRSHWKRGARVKALLPNDGILEDEVA